ncbi:MAG TPA: hypothetical protein VIR82_20625, partial [Bradyrhizobium sp.]
GYRFHSLQVEIIASGLATLEMRLFLVNSSSLRATFLLESERITEKIRLRESWPNHDIVDG